MAMRCAEQNACQPKRPREGGLVSRLEREARNRTGIFDLEANALPLSYTRRRESNKAAKRRALA
jgi:hypothetical protein